MTEVVKLYSRAIMRLQNERRQYADDAKLLPPGNLTQQQYIVLLYDTELDARSMEDIIIQVMARKSKTQLS